MRNVQKALFHFSLRAIALTGALALGAPTVGAEELPTKGTFRGIYHVNRAGVGRFNFYIIPKGLKERMAPFQGEYVEVEVLKARQPMNPGPAIVEQIGRVTVLPDPPLQISLRVVAPGIGGGSTLDVIYSLANAGKNDIVVNANHLQVGVQGYPQPQQPDEPDTTFESGYTRRQLGFGGTLVQRWNFIAPAVPGERTHFSTSEVLLRPGETAPFVLHGVALEPGEYELAAVGLFCPAREEFVPVMAAQPLDVPWPEQKTLRECSLRAEVEVTLDDGWYLLDGHLFAKRDQPVFLFTRPDGDWFFLPGLVQLYSDSGNLIPARLDWDSPYRPWLRTEIGPEGLPFRFRVRRADRFSRQAVSKIGFWTVTDQGMEKLTLAEAVPRPPERPLPLWGEQVRGCRLRIQMPRSTLDAAEEIRFFFQAESDGQSADVFWIDEGKFRSHVVAAIDGKQAPIGSTGISDGHVHRFPFQGEIALSSRYKVVPGRHTLQLRITGNSGTYTNLRGDEFRKFAGTLISNVVEFEVTGD